MKDDYSIVAEKKLPRIRRYATLGAIRREVLRCYEELRAKPNADPLEIQRSRALGYLLSTAGELLKAEKLDDEEKRLDVLEAKMGNKERP
jgi:hypothetical protein